MVDTDLHKLAQMLDLKDIPACWEHFWPASQAAYPGRPYFLQDAFVREADKVLCLEAEDLQALLATAEAVRADERLARLAWHFHYLYSRIEEIPGEDLKSWPLPEGLLGRLAALFGLAAVLGGLPGALALHRSRGIPRQVTLDTFRDVAIWIADHRKKQGFPGFGQMRWLLNHLSGRLFRLGRLQYIQSPMGTEMRAFRHVGGRLTVAFPAPGSRYREDGQADGSNGIFDEKRGWTSEFSISKGVISGHPISPDGRASGSRIELPAREWTEVLSSGEPILQIHIPADGPMTHAECGASLAQALDFFPRYFPERPFKGFTCVSWLLDPQFGDILPPGSNIVSFHREFYLFPVQRGDEQVFERVFGGKPEDLSTASRETSMQRAILDFMAAGGLMRSCGGFILNEDVPCWGGRVYRSNSIVRG